jgi:GNAT superfamily N-acetyltransferase
MTDRIIEIDAESGAGEIAGLLARTEALHRQLRPAIPESYAATLTTMLREGARLSVLFEGEQPRALAVWRVHHTTFAGLRFYVDDLVTDEAVRGRGWGGRLLAALEQRAGELGCATFTLDSGVQREAAHRFYFRAGMTITSFAFRKVLEA